MSNVAVQSCLKIFEGVVRFCFIILQNKMNHLPFIVARIESRQAEGKHVTFEYFLPPWAFLSLTSVNGIIFLGTKSGCTVFLAMVELCTFRVTCVSSRPQGIRFEVDNLQAQL